MREITTKYNSNHKKYRYELVAEPKKQVNRLFINEKLVIKVIMDCRATSAHQFKATLRFKQYNECHFNKRTFNANKSKEFIWRIKYVNNI